MTAPAPQPPALRQLITEALTGLEVEVTDGGDRTFFTTLADPGHVAAVVADVIAETEVSQ